jgi:hypothetical protein
VRTGRALRRPSRKVGQRKNRIPNMMTRMKVQVHQTRRRPVTVPGRTGLGIAQQRRRTDAASSSGSWTMPNIVGHDLQDARDAVQAAPGNPSITPLRTTCSAPGGKSFITTGQCARKARRQARR